MHATTNGRRPGNLVATRVLVGLVWMLLAFHLLLVSVDLVLVWRIARAPGVDIYLPDIVAMPTFIAFLVVGVLVVSRHPRQRFGWLLCVVGLCWQGWMVVQNYSGYAYGVRDGELFGSRLALWLASWLFFPCLCLIVAIVPLLFPTGHLPAGRWRWVFWLALAGMFAVTASFMLEPATLDLSELADDPGIGNPYAANKWVANLLFAAGAPLAILSGFAAGVSIVWRLRRAVGIERQQLKWFAFAGAVVASIFVVNTLMFIFELDIAGPVFAGQVLSFIAFPLAAGIAIVRHQLFDIDRIINRTLVYSLLTASLGSAYLALVVLPSILVFGAAGESPELLIAASTLAVAALVRPLRSRIQSVVDRRFNRAHYDAAQIVERFSARLRDEVDLESLSLDLRAVVAESMQPAHVSLWLRPGVGVRQ